MAIESLEELHYRVVVARNAREALDHLHGPERIDIMFSDVVMPGGMNGAQLADEARSLRPELKVLLTSGYVGATGSDELVKKERLPLLTNSLFLLLPLCWDIAATTGSVLLSSKSPGGPGP
jgi:CheY-like chemotaxis protein